MKYAPLSALIATLDNQAPIVALDFETYYDAICSVKELGAAAYCRHPDWDCYLVAIKRAEFVEGAWLKHPTIVCHPSELDWSALHGHRVYSHNAGFDHTVYRELVSRGLAPADFESKIEGWDCTADFSACHGNRRSLADAILFCFGRTLSKAVRDAAKGKRWPNGFTPAEREAMLAYGGTDAEECLELAIMAQELWSDKERLLSRLNRLQGMRGVKIDTPKLALFLTACRNRAVEVLREIPWASVRNPKTGKLTPPTSPLAYCQYCRDHGIPVPPVKATEGEDAYIEWEAEHAGDHSVIAAVSAYRSVTKVIKQLEKIASRVDADGIFQFSLKYAGTHTHRFAGDAGFNMQNILKADPNDRDAFWIIQDASGTLSHAGPIIRALYPIFATYEAVQLAKPKSKGLPAAFVFEGQQYTLLDLRSLLIPREGKKFIIADSSQIEPRCLAGLTNDRAFIELVKDGIDIYEAHARVMHGFTGPKGSLKDLANNQKISKYITLRARSKAERLGLGYQAGQAGYQKAAALLAGLVLTDAEALDAVQQYRAANPHVVGYWQRLQDALAKAKGRALRLRLPSGRIMTYRNVQEEAKLFIDPKTKKPVWKKQLTAETDGRRHGYYGGKICENITQGTARDVFVEYMLMAWEASLQRCQEKSLTGYTALMASLAEAPLYTVHDEVILESVAGTADNAKRTVEDIMNSTPAWMGEVPFACEASIESCYKK